jgi:TolA-binding protein
VLLNVAGCQQGLRKPALSAKILKQLIAKYPESSAAVKAKQLLEERR